MTSHPNQGRVLQGNGLSVMIFFLFFFSLKGRFGVSGP